MKISLVLKIFLFSAVLSTSDSSTTKTSRPRIIIVGSGIGGTSAAYFLKRSLPHADITIVEASGQVGGRLATVAVDGREYEVGGSIIHAANHYMVEYLDICGLRRKQGPPDTPFTLHKDGQIAFQEWGYGIMDKLRLAWRYGILSALKLEYFVDNLLKSFTGIYEKLARPDTFYRTVADMLRDMSPVSRAGEPSDEMLQLTAVTLREKLLSLGVGELLVEEMVTVAARVNYGQMPATIHAFVGAVGLAGMDGALWAVEGGNKKVAACAARLSEARMVRGTVTEISSVPGGGYTVAVESKDDEAGFSADTLAADLVVVATPLTSDVARLQLPDGAQQLFPGHYHTTVATIVQGDLVPAEIGFKDGSSYTTTNFYLSDSSNIVSIARLSPVDYRPGDEELHPVYKIFSKKELTHEELSRMFKKIKFSQSIPWLAYPQYTTEDDFSAFELGPGLYYLNRMEWAASAMEMSVISARNIANMAAAYIRQSSSVADTATAGRGREEL